MMLVEETQVAEAALPVDALKAHLRLGSGFSETDLQDDLLGSFLRAAMAAIEARTSKALIQRGFVVTFEEWKDYAQHVLPIAPVQSVTEITVIDSFGGTDTMDPGKYRLIKDNFAPKLRAAGTFPSVPEDGNVEIRFQAGYGPSFDDIPSDLQQAVMLLAAHYYEYREATGLGQGCMPFGVTSLIARYRPLRMGFGA